MLDLYTVEEKQMGCAWLKNGQYNMLVFVRIIAVALQLSIWQMIGLVPYAICQI